LESLRYSILLFAFTCSSIIANPSDSTKSKFTDNESLFGFKLGRFHFGGTYFSRDGVSGAFLNDYRISKYFYLEGSLQIYKTIGSDEGAISLNEYLSYPLTISNQKFFLKGGIGLATLGYLSPIINFEVEYIVFDFENSAISISIQQSLPKLPFIFNIGILF
jgi:hypothetical protein